jgi:organic hydroperoxide reductase OsmC/OhrA
MSRQDQVGFEVIGEYKFELRYNSALLSDHVLDYAAAKPEDRPGQMRRLLAEAACGCFSGHFYTALRKKKVHVKSLRSRATATTGIDPETGLSRVIELAITLEVDVPDSDLDALEAVEKEMSNGCLITRSLAPGIAVTTRVVRLSESASE